MPLKINRVSQSSDCISVRISFFWGWIPLTLLLPAICLTEFCDSRGPCACHIYKPETDYRLSAHNVNFLWRYTCLNCHYAITSAEHRSACDKRQCSKSASWSISINTVSRCNWHVKQKSARVFTYLLFTQSKDVRGRRVQVNHWLQLRVDELLTCKANSCGAPGKSK